MSIELHLGERLELLDVFALPPSVPTDGRADEIRRRGFLGIRVRRS